MKNSLFIIAYLLLGSSLFAQTTWYEIPTGVSAELSAIDFPTSSVGYIVGYDSTILKTTDGGQTWSQLGLNGIVISSGDDDFTDVHFVDENTGFIVSGYTGVWKTVDGAQSWSNVSAAMCFPYTVLPTSGTDYIIGGGDCFEGARLDVVSNSISTPATISTNFWDTQEIVVEMSFANSMLGLAAVRNQYMLRTIDGGSNWDTIPTNISGVHTSVVMVNDTLCYAGYDENGSGFGVLKSTDGGLTWIQDFNSVTFLYPAFLSVHAAGNGDIYAGAVPSTLPNGVIFEAEDGVNWNYTNVDQAINAMTSYGSDVTFGVGDSGYLVVNTPLAELAVNHYTELDVNFYPNPVKNHLCVQNLKGSTGQISIRDANGRLLLSKSISSNIETIDCSELSNGVYFVTIHQDNQHGTKKFIKE